jgi:glutamyl-tRNA synthetase
MNTDGSKMSKRDKAKTARKAAADSNSDAATLADRMDADRTAVAEFMDKKSDDIGIATSIAHLLDVPLPEIDVADFRHSGYLPEVLCNYLALLGWNPGNDVERFDMKFLCENFNLERIGKGNSKFDRAKLFRFNADSLAAMPADEFVPLLREHMLAYHRDSFEALCGNDEHFRRFAAAYQPRSRTLDEPATLGAFFVQSADQITFDEKAVAKVLHKSDGEGLNVLGELEAVLDASDSWQAEAIEHTVKSFAEQRELGMGKVAQPLRVAVTGSTVSPAIGDTLAILGKEQTLTRIRRCIEKCQP